MTKCRSLTLAVRKWLKVSSQNFMASNDQERASLQLWEGFFIFSKIDQSWSRFPADLIFFWNWKYGNLNSPVLLPAAHLGRPNVTQKSGSSPPRGELCKWDSRMFQSLARPPFLPHSGGFHIWSPENFGIFWPPPLLLFVRKIYTVCQQIWGICIPPPPFCADVIYGSPLTRICPSLATNLRFHDSDEGPRSPLSWAMLLLPPSSDHICLSSWRPWLLESGD